MITKQVINELYKKYRHKPLTTDELNLAPLFDYAIEHHGITIDDHRLIINSISQLSPFHSIELEHIHAIVEFDNRIAIVLLTSIIFLDKEDDSAHIHIKVAKPSCWERIQWWWKKQFTKN
jgi:hypothetical protein